MGNEEMGDRLVTTQKVCFIFSPSLFALFNEVTKLSTHSHAHAALSLWLPASLCKHAKDTHK